ncbi:MAG: protein translocase subunit SecD [Dehalococcoidales bacterium]|nr:protein translocase subunit SecD [Dehalococcoidales bacterium]
MPRGNTLVLLIVLLLFVFAVCALIFPMFGREEMRLGLDLRGGLHLVYRADMSNVEAGQEASVIEGVIAVIQNRINPLGVTEPVIEKVGADQILVELPGASVTDVQKERIGRTALLEFGELIQEGETAKWTNDLGEWKPATAEVDGVEKELTSAYFKSNTYVAQDDLGRILLVFEWDEEGSQLSEAITTRLQGERLGIFEGDEALKGDDGQPIAPTVQAVITDRGQIEGLSLNEAEDLSKQLNAGRLPVPLELVYEQDVSPVAGADFVDMSLKAGIIGIILVMAFMTTYYRLSGFLASLALLFYGALNLAIFKLIPVTLTLAGIGGFVVSIGIAVDANILIFERMKEELRAGRTLGAAIEAGFSRAWSAIWDSNVTTFIVCIILIIIGGMVASGAPVKGFGLTLLIGTIISMFTAVTVTRTLLRLFVKTPLAIKTSLFSPYVGGKK